MKNEPIFKNVSGQAVMQMDMASDQGILSYQWHMIQDNPLPGLLPLSCDESDGNVRLCWRVSALQPLSLLFERGRCGTEALVSFIRQLHMLLVRMDGILLDEDRLLLDSRWILADPIRMTLHFAYCPLMEPLEDALSVRTLLLHWMTRERSWEEGADATRMMALMEALKDPHFHWNCLESFCYPDVDDMTMDQTLQEPSAGVAARPLSRTVQIHQAQKAAPQGRGGYQPVAHLMPQSGRLPTRMPVFRRGVQWGRKAWRRILLVQVLVALLVAFCLMGGVLAENGPDGMMARWGLFLVAISMETWAVLGGVEKSRTGHEEGVHIGKGTHDFQSGPDVKGTHDLQADHGGKGALAGGGAYHVRNVQGGDGSRRKQANLMGEGVSGRRPSDVLRTGQQKAQKPMDGIVSGAPPSETAGRGNVSGAPPSETAGHGNVSGAPPSETAGYGNVSDASPAEMAGRGKVSDASPAEMAACANPTQLLVGMKAVAPYLLLKEEDELRRMEVCCSPFLIGRLRSHVDGWLGHPTVGKMHAEIRLESEGPFLVDLNSRNGTTLNGKVLVPYEPAKLHAGDHIRIAGEELQFQG